MPAFNAENNIAESILSVMNQTYENWELLITDDCSTDSTEEIVRSLMRQDSRIFYFKNSLNSGPAVSRNNSIINAKGRFIAFLDSDDAWVQDKLERQISFMILNNYSFTYTDYWIVDENNNNLGARGIPTKVNYNNLLKTNYIGCLTAIYDVSFIGKQLMPLLRKRQDYGLWLQILKKIPYAYGVNEPLALYKVHKNSLSANKLDAAKYTWALYRKVERIGFLKSLFYFCNYSFRGFFRLKRKK